MSVCSIKQLKQQANPSRSHPVSECQSLQWERGEGAQIQWELPCGQDAEWTEGGARRGSMWSTGLAGTLDVMKARMQCDGHVARGMRAVREGSRGRSEPICLGGGRGP